MPPAIARTWKLCFPLRTLRIRGELQALKPLPSSAHSNVAPTLGELNSKRACFRFVFRAGVLERTVSGPVAPPPGGGSGESGAPVTIEMSSTSKASHSWPLAAVHCIWN